MSEFDGVRLDVLRNHFEHIGGRIGKSVVASYAERSVSTVPDVDVADQVVFVAYEAARSSSFALAYARLLQQHILADVGMAWR